MDIETTVQSEVTHIYMESRKSGADEPVCRAGIEMQTQRSDVWTPGGGGTGKWKWKLLSRVRLFATPWTMQSMEFSRPEYWSG